MVAILKSDPVQQVVYGWAGKYLDVDGSVLVDLQGDMIEPEVIEKAAVSFMEDYRESGVMHEGESVGTIVASLVTTPEIVKALFGPDVHLPVGWLVGVRYPDANIYKRVVSGELAMFSIQGTAEVEDAS